MPRLTLRPIASLALRPTPRLAALMAALAACATLAAGPGAAQSALERLETLDERMNALVFDALEAEIPALSGYRPSLEWDAAMRENGACLIEAVEAQTGGAGVSQLLENYAATVEGASDGASDLGGIRLDPPQGMTPAEFQAAYAECGMLDWLSAKLAGSGALAIIMESTR
ncbi:hypothetical protein [Roseicyclus salinarum]|uniref:hypothetical protein n=1 Tax=Roseicyclus salinarum TaxID=3036773 RepID=UPI0024154E01|nr:hypothetical protein [Roseibacterium sp. SDUM158017]